MCHGKKLGHNITCIVIAGAGDGVVTEGTNVVLDRLVTMVTGKLGHIETCLLKLEGDTVGAKAMEEQVPTALVDTDEPFFTGGIPIGVKQKE